MKYSKEGETPTSERIEKESPSNKEDEVFLKATYKIDNIPGVKPCYKQLFWMCSQLVEENDKLRQHILELNESVKYLKEINNSFNIDITKNKYSRKTCDKYVSLKKEVIDLREAICKFT